MRIEIFFIALLLAMFSFSETNLFTQPIINDTGEIIKGTISAETSCYLAK